MFYLIFLSIHDTGNNPCDFVLIRESIVTKTRTYDGIDYPVFTFIINEDGTYTQKELINTVDNSYYESEISDDTGKLRITTIDEIIERSKEKQ